MTYTPTARLTMTAIAAVLALSSPSLAQDTGATPAPATDTVVTTPDPVATDPLAPETTTPTSATEAATASKAAPVTKTARAKAAKPVSRTARSTATQTTTRTTSAATTAPAVAAPAAATATPPAPTPLPTAQIIPPPSGPALDEPVVQPVAEDQGLMADDALPIAGAAGIGLLALAGAGMALRRRRRRREEELGEYQWDEAQAEAEPESAAVEPEPVFVRSTPLHDSVPARSPVAAAAIAGAPTTDLPAGFDVSRFGRHVQAAYRGPTADNPSLSLRNRLRRASFFDQREKAGLPTGIEGQPEPASQPAAKPAVEPAWTSSNGRNSDFMFGRDSTKKPADPVTQH